MMGSGKTTCGTILAKKLKVSFIDIDSIIELEEKLKYQLSLPKIRKN